MKLKYMVCIAAALFTAGGCRQRVAQPQPAPEPPRKPPVELTIYTDDARVRWMEPGSRSRVIWEATAGKAETDRTQGGASGLFRQVTSTLYSQDGRPTDMKAGRVQADEAKRVLQVSEGLQATSRGTGVTLTSERATWLVDKDLIVAEGHVRLTGDGLDIRGARMELSTDLTRMTLYASDEVKETHR